MSEPTPDHPDPDVLADFGLGRLDPQQSGWIEDHLSRCQQCCDTLHSLKDDTFAGLVRGLPAPAEPNAAAPDVDSRHVATIFVQSGESTELSELPEQLHDHPRYRIVELIGKGGMGDVYRAEHKLMNRPVALKLINSQLVKHPQAVERFRREVQAAAQLTHPNIVTAFDAEQAGNVHFLAMEFVEGTDLATVVQKRGTLPVAQACDCIRQVADGLQHAHEKGMVHRDIKPHNLMLSPGGQIRILDFGLASFATESALAEAESTPDADGGTTPLHLTTFGSVMGTPDYIAPEQAHDAHSADIRADIYSLGCTLHFLLGGEPPHQADSVVEKLQAHATQEPPKLSDSRDDIPAELQKVVDRMLAKDPKDRFQTPAEVADALAGFVDKHRTDGGGRTNPSVGTSAPMNPLPITFALCFAGTLSILAFVLAVVLFMAGEWISGIPTWILSWLQFGGLASLPVGVAALILADRSERKNSHQSAVKAGLLNLLPLNPFVVVLLPLTVWTLLRLRHPSARTMYENCPAVDRAEDRRRWPLVITTTACLLIAIYAGTFFIIQLGQTTLRFEIDDPTLAVRFGDDMISVDNDGQTIHITPGEKQQFVVEQNGAEVETDSLTLRKGDKVVLRVSLVDGELVVDGSGIPVSRKPVDRQSTRVAVAEDQKLIQGTWRHVSLVDNGQQRPPEEFEDRFITFTGDRFTGPQKRQPLPGKFTLDATTKPRKIDLHIPSGPESLIPFEESTAWKTTG